MQRRRNETPKSPADLLTGHGKAQDAGTEPARVCLGRFFPKVDLMSGAVASGLLCWFLKAPYTEKFISPRVRR